MPCVRKSIWPSLVASSSNSMSSSKNNGRFARFATTLISPFARSARKGGETGVYLCSAPEVGEGRETNGGYFYDMKPRTLAANARQPEDAARLWEVSLSLTGLSA